MEFYEAMNRGIYREEGKSSYCIFFAPLEEFCARNQISPGGVPFVLELRYGREEQPGALRIRQVETNAILEESAQGLFRQFLQDKPVKYFGHLLMYALQFKIQDLSRQIEDCKDQIKMMEDSLDSQMDNSGTYELLDYRRSFADCGNQLLELKEIMARIDKGYYSEQMQNGYVQQGETILQFDFLEQRYELVKNTILKDFDTYTSIVNNNINRNTRLLSIISLGAVAVNLMLGSFLASNAVLGIVGGLVVGGVGIGATAVYRINHRRGKELTPGRGSVLAFPAHPGRKKKEDRHLDRKPQDILVSPSADIEPIRPEEVSSDDSNTSVESK